MKVTTKLLTAAVLAAALAGCGDGEEAAPEGAGTSASTTSASTTTTSGSSTTAEDTSEGADDGATTSTPSFTGEGSEAFCTMSEEFDLESAFAEAETPEDLQASFEQVVTALDQMTEEAPAEIRDDVAAVSQAWEGLRQPLEEAGWDLMRLDPQVLNTPELDQLQGSTDRLDAYMSDVCGIETTETEG